MAVKVTMIAMGKWDDRASLTYVPVNEPVNGVRYGAYGAAAGSNWDVTSVRRPYKTEDGSSPAYVMYDDDSNGPVPIYKIEEA